MDKSKALSMLYTVALVFGVTFGTQMLSTGLDIFNIDLSAVQSAVNAAIGAVIAVLINAANPYVTRYGVGSE